MKNIARFVIALAVGAFGCVAYAALPQINVTVADASGKTAYKGATDTKGVFATPKLPAGNYAVQFSCKSAPKGAYTMVVSAGKKKVVANAIAAEKLTGGGVAMKIDVAAGVNITGQVATEDQNAPRGKNGKPMVWIPKKVGSNMAAHWAESDSAEAKEAQTSSSYSSKNLQDKQNSGSSPDQR